MTLVAACLTLASCDEKDEPEPGTDGDVTIINNTRLLKVGNYDFGYDSSGRLSTLGEDGETYAKFDYSKGQVWMDGECTNIKFNSNGYLSEIKVSEKYNDEEHEGSYNASVIFSYDSNGRITKRTQSWKSEYTYISDGVSYSNEEKSTTIYHWTGDILTSMEYEGKYQDIYDGQIEEETDNCVTTFTYDDIDNTSRQYSFSMGRAVTMDEELGLLQMVGLLGKGPAKLPVAISKAYSYISEYGTSEGEDLTTVEYMFNADGTIATERIINDYDDYTLDYTYGTPSKSASNITPMKPAKKKARKSLRHRHAF